MADDNKIVLKIQIEKDGSTATLKNFKNEVIKSGVAIKDLSNSLGNFTTSRLKMNGQVKVTTEQFKRLEKSVGGFKTATGASTSATLELGRVLSDMPYGIRGVANNLQQLASNLFFMSKATDAATGKSVGFGGALKNLLGGLIGPAGILIAFQGIIALFDYFSSGAKKAEEETNNLNLSIGGSATKLKALKKALDDGLMSREEANEAVNAANKEFKDLNLTLNDNVKLTEDSVLAINNKIEALVNLSKAQALQALLEKKYSELLPLQAKQNELDAKATKAEINAVEALSKNYKEFGTAKEEALASSARSAATENERAVEKIEKDISDLLKLSTDDGILDLMFNGKKGAKGKGRDRVKNFKYDFADIGDDVKDAKKYLKAVADGLGVDLKKNPLEIDTDLDFNLTEETQDRLAKAMAQITKDKIFSSKLREYSDYAEQTKEVITAMSDFATSEFDRELTIEQNKTNALNNELNKRLLNENLSKDEREKIQNQIAQNDEKLRLKQEKIERKRFKMQKAANIATALIDTFRAAAGVMADEKGGFLQRLSAAIPTIAFGMAQVAAISRQKFQSSAGSSPTLVGTGSSVSQGSERAEPSFNIVGRSNENILMSAIQSQFDQPLRAYVVARDVTNQQQLDGVITGAAGT